MWSGGFLDQLLRTERLWFDKINGYLVVPLPRRKTAALGTAQKLNIVALTLSTMRLYLGT